MKNWLKLLLTLCALVLLLAGVFEMLGMRQSEIYTPDVPRVSYAKRKDFNLIFVSIDTLRADRLGLYGYERPTSPNLDAFSEKTVIFDNAISVSSWTLPTHMTFFTGMFPSVHGVNRPAKIKLDGSIELLSEIAKRQGYRTFAYTGGGYVGGGYGFSRGFEHYGVHKGKKRDGEYDITGSLAGIKESINSLRPEEKFFLFFHTFDAHCPYNSPEPYMSMFSTEGAEYIDPYKCGTNFYNKRKMKPGQVKYISDRYDGGIRWVDTKMQELFDFLNAKNLMQKTIIVITSDHGEELYDHGSIGHKRSLFRELIRVPLMIYVPGIEPGRIPAEVSTVDLFDTLIDALELKTEQKTNGISLWPLINSKDSAVYPRRFQFSELDGEVVLRSHIDDSGHMIHKPSTSNSIYYDIKLDPQEQNEISTQNKEEVKRRLSEIKALEDSFKKKEAGVLEEQSDEEVERLRSLGYF